MISVFVFLLGLSLALNGALGLHGLYTFLWCLWTGSTRPSGLENTKTLAHLTGAIVSGVVAYFVITV